jgi:integrase
VRADARLSKTAPLAPELPAESVARNGVTFWPRRSVWAFRSAAREFVISFENIRGVDPTLVPSLKGTLYWYACNKSPAYVCFLFYRFSAFFREVSRLQHRPVDEITDSVLLNFRATLSANEEWQLSSIAAAIKKWHGLGYPGVPNKAVRLLRSMRLKGNVKGAAVLTMDPETGPFTDIELESVQAALTAAFARGDVLASDFIATWLLMLTAARPVQLAALKTGDVRETSSSDGTVSYSIAIPRAKQRDVASRAELKIRPLIPQVGEFVAKHAREIEQRFRTRLPDPSTAPLFPGRSLAEVVEPGLEWHQTGETLSKRIIAALSRIRPHSERTGGPLAITPIRFRRTIGTRAAAEGYGELVIAELLDQSDTQTVRVYVEMRPEILRRIDKAVALKMAPLARAFAGAVVTDAPESEPRITDLRFDSHQPAGSCRGDAACSLAAPVACYTCVSFHAWLDGPHEELLEHLLRERERLLGTTDQRVASINDRTILAAAEVVQLCRRAKARSRSRE